MQLLSMMRLLYQSNQTRRLYISYRNQFIQDLYEKARVNVSHDSLFFTYLKNLYDVNQQRGFSLSLRNRYIQFLMNQCFKECSTIVDVANPRKKAALLIGINYHNTSNELNGCENDIYATKKVLINNYGFNEKDILILTETEKEPTRQNILAGIDWLVKKADEGFGSLWFQYSGHGYYFKDKNGDEADGYDECIVTSDNYVILDDEFRSRLVNKVRSDSKLFCLFDCCHSGTMLDLRFKYKPDENRVELENRVSASCNIITLSGCRDDQESADAWFTSSWAGALTKNFLEVLKKHDYSPNLFTMMKDIKSLLVENEFTQIPQLTSSKELIWNDKLTI